MGEASHTLEVDVGVGVICAHHHTCNVWAVPDADITPAVPCLDKHALSLSAPFSVSHQMQAPCLLCFAIATGAL